MTSLAARAFSVLVVRGVVLAASLAASVITARALGPEGRGQYYFAIMVGALAIQFGTLGLHASNAYLVAQSRERMGALITNSVWVSVAVGGIVALCIPLANAADASFQAGGTSLYWVAVYVPAGLFIQLANSVLLGAGSVSAYNIAQIAVSLTTTVGLAIALNFAHEPQNFVAAFAIGNLLVAVGMLIGTQGLTRRHWRFDSAAFRQSWHFAAKSFAVSVLGFLVLRTNVFLIEHLHSPAELGFYSVAMQFLDLISLVPASIATILFPALVGSASAWPETRKHAVLVVGLVVVGSIALAMALEPVIRFVFGPSFLDAETSVLALLPAAAFLGVTTIFSQYLAAKGLPLSVLAVWSLSVLIAIASGYALIPAFGAAGAATSLSLTSAVTALFMGTLAVRRSRREISYAT